MRNEHTITRSRKRQPIAPADVAAMKRRGMKPSAIAKELGVSRQWIYKILETLNDESLLTPREYVLRKHFPWKISEQFSHAAPVLLIRDHGEYMATGGKGMPERKLKALRGFYRRLRESNTVVVFDPSIPPIIDVSAPGGFDYVPRTEEDGDLLIRVNEYTNLTDEGKRIWRFPKREP